MLSANREMYSIITIIIIIKSRFQIPATTLSSIEAGEYNGEKSSDPAIDDTRFGRRAFIAQINFWKPAVVNMGCALFSSFKIAF